MVDSDKALEMIAGREIGISEFVFATVPRYRRYVLFATGAAPERTPPALIGRFATAVATLQNRVALDTLAESPIVAPWREAFRSFGWSPAKFRSSIEALTRRALRSELQPLNITLVDCGTIATLEHNIPIGVHVLDELPMLGKLFLGPANGSERFELFDGSVENPDPGEIIYKCDDIVLTRKWVWRQGRVGSVAGDPHALAVNVDVIEPSNVQESVIVDSVTELLATVGFHVLYTAKLDGQHPCAVVGQAHRG